VADLRTRFIEDYAGGLLNIARQELSSTGEVLAQDGFPETGSLFVEDGRGVKSGIRLGSGLAECVDPMTETGILNVRSADRTYAKIRELKIFATAIASSQAALSESVAESAQNLESAFETLESEFERLSVGVSGEVEIVNTSLGLRISSVEQSVEILTNQISQLEQGAAPEPDQDRVVILEQSTGPINDQDSFELDLNSARYFGLLSIETSVPAWITVYTDRAARARDNREGAGSGPGVIADAVTTAQNFQVDYLPLVVGYSENGILRVRVVNQSGSRNKVNVKLRHIRL
jgi:hypothetical protein